MTCAAPKDLASWHFSSLPAVPISCRPSALAHWQAIRPTPPAAAWNSTWSPACRPPWGWVRLSRYCAVSPLSIMAAPVDVDEVQADGLVPDADLAVARLAHLHVHQFHLFGAALLADLHCLAHCRLLAGRRWRASCHDSMGGAGQGDGPFGYSPRLP